MSNWYKYYISTIFEDDPAQYKNLVNAIIENFYEDHGGIDGSFDVCPLSRAADIYIESYTKLNAGDISRIQSFIFGWVYCRKSIDKEKSNGNLY